MKILNNLTPDFTSGFTYNYLKSPEDFSNTSVWTRSNIASVTTNSVNDPIYGTLTADTITSANNVQGIVFQDIDYTSVIGSRNTVYSVYVKSNTSNTVQISSESISTTTGTYTTTYFQVNLSTGTIVNTVTYNCVTGTCTVVSSGNRGGKVDNIGNGWYRVSFFDIPTNYGANTKARFTIFPDADGTNKSIYAWGAQVELTTATTATQAFATLPSKYISTSVQENLAEFSYPYKFPKWNTNNVNGKEYSKALRALTNSTAETLSYISFTSSATTYSAYGGAISNANGFIYTAPNTSGYILKFNPATDSIVSEFTTASQTTYSYTGGVLSSNGSIYYVPFSSDRTLKLNTSNDTTNLVGTSYTGTGKWAGAVMAPTGKIFGIPNGRTSVLILDPANNDSTTEITTTGLAATSGWWGGVLSPNGSIYAIPLSTTRILRINTADETTTGLSLLSTTLSQSGWAGGVLAPNGFIYGVPYDATGVLKIDPVANTATLPASFGTLSGSTKWAGGVLAPNGMIYCNPRNATTILRINPNNDTAVQFGILPSDTQKWYNFHLAINENIYAFPFNISSKRILKVNLGISSDVPQDFNLSRYHNKL